MTIQKSSCDACNESIQQSTRDKTGGLCMPCHQKRLKHLEEKYNEENRRELDPFDGIVDPVEILKIMHRKREEAPLIVERDYPLSRHDLACRLDQAQTNRLARYLLELANSDRASEAFQLASTLKRSTDQNIDQFLKLAIEDELDCPDDFLFHHAGAEVRDLIFSLIAEDPDTYLIRLSWIGDSEVQKQFSTWRKTKPSWAEELNLSPEEYSLNAGWELTEKGERRDLCFAQCFPIESPEKDSQTGEISAIINSTKRCPSCGKNLITLLETDLKSLTFTWNGENASETLTFSTCERCVLVSNFTISNKVASGWELTEVSLIIEPSDDTEQFTRNKSLSIGAQRNCLYAASDELDIDNYSQIGGYPNWQQGPIYPHCPKCSKRMMFFAQVEGDLLEGGPLGFFYAFICELCKRNTAVVYQTT